MDWEAVAVTAQSSDFVPQRGTVELTDGVSSTQLPLSIINDNEPEFEETLSVNLVGSGGGARLDGTLAATVTIPASDDPNGALREYKNYQKSKYRGIHCVIYLLFYMQSLPRGVVQC